MASVCIHLFSCQVIEEVDEPMLEEVTTLKINTRSSDTEPIPYPMSLYAFNERGECGASQLMTDENDRMELVLPAGNYRIVAVAGYTGGYQMPEEPSLDEVISLEAAADVPLMMGAENIEIEGNGDVSIEIALSYVVAGVNITLKSIPPGVSAVSFSLSPLYSSVSLAGKYMGDSLKVGASCFLSEGDVWKSDTLYMFPGSTSESLLTIVLEGNDGSRNEYEYTYAGCPVAGRFLNLVGNYCEGISIAGCIIGGNWSGTDDVSFDFGVLGQPDRENQEPETSVTELPEIGTIWNGAIVADVIENDSTGTEILLLSLEEWDATTVQVEDIKAGYSVNGITDWRLPSYEEAKMFRNRFCGEARLALNHLISDYDEDLYGLDGEERYLCDKEGEFYSFVFSAGKPISQAGTQRSYYVRLVKNYRL